MKKIFLLLLLFPIFIKAVECDYKKQNEKLQLSYNISYQQFYNSDNKSFKIVFYNIYEGIYLVYNNNVYYPNSNNEVEIDNINEGSHINISVNSSVENCKSFLRTLNINFGYFNPYYGSNKCYEYENKLKICNSEFLSYKPTEELLNKSIENYKKAYTEEKKQEEQKVEEPEEEIKIYQEVQSFVDEWGIQMILFIVTSMITVSIFRVKFRKIKHGI